jgi:hypothetical protein
MVQDPQTERLLGDIELVRSRGDPERMRLCIMSLVARLAGEAHSDQPAAASPLIAAFARPINDAMDRPTRQRLVPFAPRILGTAAREDAARREILHHELMHTLLPAIVTDLQAGARGQAQARAAELTAILVRELAATPLERQPALVQSAEWDHAAVIGPLRVAVTAYRDSAGVQQAEAFARRRLIPDQIVYCGAESVLVPYVDPGALLARAVAERVDSFRVRTGGIPRTICLRNHGLIALGATASEVKAAILMAEKSARMFVGALQAGGPDFLPEKQVCRIETRQDEQYRREMIG